MTDQRLIVGARSVIYIISLLWLVIYIFAILGCNLFGANDPARFGTVSVPLLAHSSVAEEFFFRERNKHKTHNSVKLADSTGVEWVSAPVFLV